MPSRTLLTSPLRRRVAAAVALAVASFLSAVSPAQAADRVASVVGGGYWLAGADGGLFSFGTARFFGSTGGIRLIQRIVGIAATPSGNGYWMVATDGEIFSFGDAKFFGSAGAIKLNRPIVGMTATPSGNGYWLVASDGGIFAFGDAGFFGSTGPIRLNKPIVGMSATPSGRGYWFVASDGGIFAFGDAQFFGSAGNAQPSRPITAMAATPTEEGYWLTAADGSLFAFGDATIHGSRPRADRTVAAMVPTRDGAGYWETSNSGELLAFGNAAQLGGLAQAPNQPIVGMAAGFASAAGTQGTGPNVPASATDPAKSDGNVTTPSTNGGTTPNTTTTTPATPPGATGPTLFASTAKVSWGIPSDPARTFVNSNGETTYPYSQKVAATAEIGNRVYIGGEFTDIVNDERDRTPSGIPVAYLAELDTNGLPRTGSAFNARVKLDGAVRTLFPSLDGHRLYVGGEFNRVNGGIRRRLVALEPATGALTPWQPDRAPTAPGRPSASRPTPVTRNPSGSTHRP